MVAHLARRVAVVGLGAMGTPMAGRLAARGHAVVAVDPSPQARARAAALGIGHRTDVSSAPACDLVLVLVENGVQVLDTVRAAAAARGVRDETWLICSTVGTECARTAAEILVDAGADVLDAPVLGGVRGAENGTLRFLVAGEGDQVARVETALSMLGTFSLVGHRPGDGQSTKMVNQLCSSVHLAVAAEAIALAKRLGLDPDLTARALTGTSELFDDRSPRMASDDPDPAVITRLAILAKDNRLVEAEAVACSAHVPLLTTARRQYERAAELGLLEADDSQIIQTYLA